jgi:hypothetical protein
MTARSTLALFRLWAVLLLATVGLQAMTPVPAPLQRETGSAFSAATADVALVSTRRGDAARLAPVPAPAVPEAEPTVRLAPSAASFLPAERVRPAVRGPPPRRSAQRLPDLRGPPLA